jgi:hypothetical protein
MSTDSWSASGAKRLSGVLLSVVTLRRGQLNTGALLPRSAHSRLSGMRCGVAGYLTAGTRPKHNF